MKSRQSISRRQFIKSASAAVLVTPLLLSGQERTAPLKAGKSRVILVRDLNVLDENGLPQQAVVQEMLDTGIKALTGKPDPQSAWKTIIKPDDIVGIKNNRWPYLRTTAEVENALKKRIMEVGVKETNISVDDLGVDTLLCQPLVQRAHERQRWGLREVDRIFFGHFSEVGGTGRRVGLHLLDVPAPFGGALERLDEELDVPGSVVDRVVGQPVVPPSAEREVGLDGAVLFTEDLVM